MREMEPATIPDDVWVATADAYELYRGDMLMAYRPCEPDRKASILKHFARAILAERKRCDQAYEALRMSNQCLRDVATNVGPLHAFWDVIAANDAILAGYK